MDAVLDVEWRTLLRERLDGCDADAMKFLSTLGITDVVGYFFSNCLPCEFV